jgi:hypothetical protein
MKKPKTVADLLAVADVCIEVSEARARLLESRGKGPARRKDDREVNTAERGDWKDHRDQGFCEKQSSGQKERRPFRRPDDTEKWCEIHRRAGHDLEECKTFLDCKRCHHQHHWRRKSPGEAIIAGKILMMTSIWPKSA